MHIGGEPAVISPGVATLGVPQQLYHLPDVPESPCLGSVCIPCPCRGPCICCLSSGSVDGQGAEVDLEETLPESRGPTGQGGVSRASEQNCLGPSRLLRVSVTGQAPVKQTLKWRSVCRFLGAAPVGSEGGRIGQREKLSCDAVTAKASATPGPAGGPTRCEGDHPLRCPFTSHWMWAASRKRGNLEGGGSLQPRTRTRKRGSPWSSPLPTLPTAGRTGTQALKRGVGNMVVTTVGCKG